MGRPRKEGNRSKYDLMRCVLYPESQQKAIEYIQQNWSCAWAQHDKDTWSDDDLAEYVKENGDSPDWSVGDLKKLHVHFIIRFPNRRHLSGVATELSQVNGSRIPSGAMKTIDTERGAYEYLWHKDSLTKYNYDSSIVYVHNYDVPDENTGAYMSEKAQAAKILAMPADLLTLEAQINWCLENDCYEHFSSKYVMWRDWRQERAARIAAETRGKVTAELSNNYYGIGSDYVADVKMRRLTGPVPFEEK